MGREELTQLARVAAGTASIMPCDIESPNEMLPDEAGCAQALERASIISALVYDDWPPA